jgi:putative tRNA adenosine deaminase-associated protein
VSYFAAAVVRSAGEWSASQVGLDDAADGQDIADRLRVVEPDADVALMFVECDETYLAILRLDEEDDLRVFSPDGAFAEQSRVGALIFGEEPKPAIEVDASLTSPGPDTSGLSDVEPARGAQDPGDPTEVEPAGDPSLLDDLGVSAARLLDLCGRPGMLPSDITAEVSAAIGAGDEVEELREA